MGGGSLVSPPKMRRACSVGNADIAGSSAAGKKQKKKAAAKKNSQLFGTKDPSIAAWATAMQCIARHGDAVMLQKIGWKSKRCNAAERATAAALIRHAGLVPHAVASFRRYRAFVRGLGRHRGNHGNGGALSP